MKKINFICAAFVLAAMTMVSASCEKDSNNDEEQTITELHGRYSTDLVLKKGNYTLTGSLQMQAPATLKIEAGTTITAADNGEIIYILIEQGAKIQAVGTKDEPIVLTSVNKKAGAWGGIHICGKAHTNSGKDTKSEIGDAPYGGNVEDDNSGELKYVRIEYSGYALDSEHEANGLSLYGVGNGTKISYIQIDKGSDDGIEFFGGSANIDHCVVTDCSDDSYDWTEGWNGKAEYIVAYQTPQATLGYDCDCLMECDNNGSNADATPVSHPVIRNATLIGNTVDGGKSDGSRGIRLRAGTQVELYDVLVYGKDKAITVATDPTIKSLAEGVSKIKNVVISNELVNDDKTDVYTNTQFVAAGNKAGYDFSKVFSGKFIGQVDGAGAVSASQDWTAGWTK